MMQFHPTVLAASMVAALGLSLGSVSPLSAGVRDTSSEEATCKDIGFQPKTAAYGDCVLKLIARNAAAAVPLSPDEQACHNYGFIRGTTQFSQCLMQQEARRRDAQEQQQQLAIQQQQLAIQQQQQQALAEAERRRRNDREAAALMGLSQMLLGSRPTYQPTPSINMTCKPEGYWRDGKWYATSAQCTGN